MFGRSVGETASTQTHRLLTLPFTPTHAANHHELFVRGMKVPRRCTSTGAFDQQHRCTPRRLTLFHCGGNAIRQIRNLLELARRSVLNDWLVVLLSRSGCHQQGSESNPITVNSLL